MDRNLVLAIALSLVVLMTWSAWEGRRRGEMTTTKPPPAETQAEPTAPAPAPATPRAAAPKPAELRPAPTVVPERLLRVTTPLYEAQPPTGYPDVAEAWVNTGALLARMNFALALAQNRLSGVRVDLARSLGEVDRARPAAVLDRLVAVVLHGEASPGTRRVLQAQLDSPEIVRATADDRGPRNTDVEKLAALVLGSPEFQRR